MPSKKCEADGCGKWASFNHPGLKRPQFCRPHAVSGMVNVVSRQRCNFADCPKQANFNHPGESRGLFCKAHIQPGMVDVRHKHCEHDGCPKQATCNHPGASAGAYCGQHKLDGMVNVVLKRCQHEGCTVFPSFGNPGTGGVQYCRTHKLPGMVRRTSSGAQAVPGGRHQDVEQMQMDPGRCAHPGCGDCRPIYCFNHYQEHQHNPINQQMEEAHMHANSHIQGYDLHHLQQQIQSQEDVHGSEHMQGDGNNQHVIGHQLPMDSQHHMHVETGIPAGYPEYTAWQQQALAAQQGLTHQHEISAGEHHTYDPRLANQNHESADRSSLEQHTYDSRTEQEKTAYYRDESQVEAAGPNQAYNHNHDHSEYSHEKIEQNPQSLEAQNQKLQGPQETAISLA